MGVIYTITNPKGKVYVGKTYDLRKRINCHKHEGKKPTKKGRQIILYNSIRKYGWGNHILEVIETVPNELLNEREIYWITELKTYSYENKRGMNLTKGGEGQRSTWMHDLERRKLMSERFSGVNNPFYGKKHTKKTIKDLSQKISGINIAQGKKVPQWGAEKGKAISSKAVVVYNSTGDFVGEFGSVADAAKYLNQDRRNLSGVLCGFQKSANGFIIRYKTNNFPLTIPMDGIKIKKFKRAVLLLNEMREILNEFVSAKEASDYLQIPQGSISRAANKYNYKPIHNGHIFKYKDEHN